MQCFPIIDHKRSLNTFSMVGERFGISKTIWSGYDLEDAAGFDG
jgi:hypothetical protein